MHDRSAIEDILPPVSVLDAYGDYVEAESVLSEYWFVRDFSQGSTASPSMRGPADRR